MSQDEIDRLALAHVNGKELDPEAGRKLTIPERRAVMERVEALSCAWLRLIPARQGEYNGEYR